MSFSERADFLVDRVHPVAVSYRTEDFVICARQSSPFGDEEFFWRMLPLMIQFGIQSIVADGRSINRVKRSL